MTAMTFTACPARHAGDCDAVLSTANVLATVRDHGFAAVENDGVVEAYEPATVFPLDGSPAYDDSKWVPVPAGVHALAIWLGY